MARFSVHKLRFGDHAGPDDNGEGLPLPLRVKLAARRAAGIREAKAVLDHLPGPGDSLHALCTARMDLTDVVGALLDKLGRCDRLLIGTLGYNARNLQTMLRWLDTGAVRELTLLAGGGRGGARVGRPLYLRPPDAGRIPWSPLGALDTVR